MRKSLLALALLFTLSCINTLDHAGTGVSCSISGYRTKQIGNQIWMAENLNCNVAGSKCYGNNPANCAIYGRLYDWATAMGIDAKYNSQKWGGSDVKHRGICPAGWHIPNNADWDELYRYVDGSVDASSPYYSETAGTKLKAMSGWNGGGNGQDIYDFSALPGGYGSLGGSFNYIGQYGNWWSASEDESDYAYYRFMYYFREGAYWSQYYEDFLFSVRCLKD